MGRKKSQNLPKQWPERCAKCQYRAGQDSPYNCDYAWFTGHSRSAMVNGAEELVPERCPFYEEGARIVLVREDWWN